MTTIMFATEIDVPGIVTQYMDDLDPACPCPDEYHGLKPGVTPAAVTEGLAKAIQEYLGGQVAASAARDAAANRFYFILNGIADQYFE